MKSLKLLTALSALSLSVTFAATAPMSQNMSKTVQSLSIVVRAGDQVALLDAAGHLLATVNANGTVNLTPGASLANTAKVDVTLNGVTTAYIVSTAADGQTLVTGVDSNGRITTLPLATFVQRLVQGAPLPGQVMNQTPRPGTSQPQNGQSQNGQHENGQNGQHKKDKDSKPKKGKDGQNNDGQHQDGEQNDNEN